VAVDAVLDDDPTTAGLLFLFGAGDDVEQIVRGAVVDAFGGGFGRR
jgi:hypothetical protein